MTRILIACVLFVVGTLSMPSVAAAAPVGGSSSGRTSTRQRPAGDASVRYRPPERIVGGNAISLLMPFQIGIVGYLPKARFAFQYDRQIDRAHWIYGAFGIVGDHGSFENFRMDRCGFEDPSGARPPGLCGNGSVLGFDIALGYVHKWYVQSYPAIVPFMRAGLGFGWWKYPELGDDPLQDRDHTFTMSLRPSGGVRFFVLGDLGLGFEVELPLGFSVHDRTLEGEGGRTDFLLGVATLLGLEYRF